MQEILEGENSLESHTTPTQKLLLQNSLRDSFNIAVNILLFCSVSDPQAISEIFSFLANLIKSFCTLPPSVGGLNSQLTLLGAREQKVAQNGRNIMAAAGTLSCILLLFFLPPGTNLWSKSSQPLAHSPELAEPLSSRPDPVIAACCCCSVGSDFPAYFLFN